MRGPIAAAAMIIAALSAAAVGAQSATARPDGPFLLFFDWGKPDVTGDAAAVIDMAVAAYRQKSGDRLLIAGHTDRSGNASYNRLASRRRAEAVRNELVKRGVPANAMSVVAYGEEQPIVPTEDGVREVQNRRVEITIEPPVR
ncbi:MAG TPA: OmpA family protein [Sphingomicrobium sp.]|nr:OmpA family protein [Sphingomicrobium sp.]